MARVSAVVDLRDVVDHGVELGGSDPGGGDGSDEGPDGAERGGTKEHRDEALYDLAA